MPITRDDPALWPRFEALRDWASVRLYNSANGWLVTLNPRDNSAPIECERADLLDAVASIVNEAEQRPAPPDRRATPTAPRASRP